MLPQQRLCTRKRYSTMRDIRAQSLTGKAACLHVAITGHCYASGAMLRRPGLIPHRCATIYSSFMQLEQVR